MFLNTEISSLTLLLLVNLFGRTSAIVFGEDTTIQENPFMAALLDETEFQFCGGAIYSEYCIVTAAHCVEDRVNDPDGLHVKVGSTRLSSTNLGQIGYVKRIVVHPDRVDDDFDIAVLELYEPLTFNENVSSIPLVNYQVSAGSLATVFGWGAINPGIGLITSDTLKKVDVKIVSQRFCNVEYLFTLTENMIFAGYVYGVKDSCNGDSGGALVFLKQLIGLVSFGRGCALPLSPGVNSNIFTMRQFVIDNARKP